jgi:hypothetical protein
MIKGINTSGRYITVAGGSVSAPYINPNNQSAGMMRYNTMTNQIEVYDGSMWLTLSTSYATVELNPDAESLLEWARRERDKQLKREHLIQNNPALQKAYEAIKKAEANFDILEKFVEHDKEGIPK